MSTPSIQELVRYADLQMAAEAFLVEDSGALKARMDQALVAGNNHASRFTPTQAEAFLQEWEVVTQLPTTTTGFSGTLFRSKNTRELVISLRSTEFIDDYARDNQATNNLEIRQTGYAWGQLSDMVGWIEGLKRSLLPPGSPFTVTGYSLGGHLATARGRA